MRIERVEPDLYAGPDLGGNAAKARALEQLAARISTRRELAILDIGCAGPRPLEFWAPLLEQPSLEFHLTGLDVAGIERARSAARGRGWEGRVRLLEGSAYTLSSLVEPASFDIAVATQVLEHVARLDAFLAEVSRCLKPGGECYITADSAEFAGAGPGGALFRSLKNAVKIALARVGHEGHYDLAWPGGKIRQACRSNGLEVLEIRYYNLPALKRIHNAMAPGLNRNEVMRRWLALEDFLNDIDDCAERAKGEFLGVYLHARKARCTAIGG